MFGEWPGDHFLLVCCCPGPLTLGPSPSWGRGVHSVKQDVVGRWSSPGCPGLDDSWCWACQVVALALGDSIGPALARRWGDCRRRTVTMGPGTVWGGFQGARPLPQRFGGFDQAKKREKHSQLRPQSRGGGEPEPRGAVEFCLGKEFKCLSGRGSRWRHPRPCWPSGRAMRTGVHLHVEGSEAGHQAPAGGWGMCSSCLRTRVPVPAPPCLSGCVGQGSLRPVLTC